MPHFVFDENNNRVEAYSAQEVLAIIEQAIADGSLANVVAGSAFVTKLKCCVSGQTNYVAFTTQATYNEMEANGTLVQNCYYFIIDDTTAEDMATRLQDVAFQGNILVDKCNRLQSKIEELQSRLVGAEKKVLLWSGSFEPPQIGSTTSAYFVVSTPEEGGVSYMGRTFEFVTENHGVYRVHFFGGSIIQADCYVPVENTYAKFSAVDNCIIENFMPTEVISYEIHAHIKGTLDDNRKFVIREVYEVTPV